MPCSRGRWCWATRSRQLLKSGPRRGVRVAVDPAVPCGRCDLCANDLGHLCRELKFAGHGMTDGGLQTLMVWPRRLLAPIPDSIADDEAALLEPLGVALHALDLGKIQAGMSVGVFGCGPIGLLTIRVLRQLGVSQIVATDPLAGRRDAALAAGASDARESASDAHWPELDVVFEVAGADGAVHDAVAAVRPGGRDRPRRHPFLRPNLIPGVDRAPQGPDHHAQPADARVRSEACDRAGGDRRARPAFVDHCALPARPCRRSIRRARQIRRLEGPDRTSILTSRGEQSNVRKRLRAIVSSC